MADLKSRPDYNGAYSGLVKNLWLTIGIAGICLVGYEIEVRILDDGVGGVLFDESQSAYTKHALARGNDGKHALPARSRVERHYGTLRTRKMKSWL
jgi:hypothetical protein